MNEILAGETVLVIGAGGLLGSKVTKHALDQGAKVLAVDLNRDYLKKKLLDNSVNVSSPNLEISVLDITDEQSLIKFLQKNRKITGAVNCSYPRNSAYGAPFYDVKLSDFNENLSLHLGSSFLFIQQCAKYFDLNRKPFSLVNISSIYGVVAPEFDLYEGTTMTMPVEYAAIKSSILHLSKYAIKYVNNSLFRINTVSPGGILDKQPESFLHSYRALTNGTGMLEVKDIVGTIVFLLSPMSKFVTGQNIIVDDGFTL